MPLRREPAVYDLNVVVPPLGGPRTPVATRLRMLRESLRREFLPALAATGDVRLLRLGSVTVMLGIVAYGRGPAVASMLAAIILFAEALLILARRFATSDGALASRETLVMFWCATWTASWCYFAPAILIADLHSVPLLITALLWTFGVFTHIANSYTRLPVFLWSQLVPGYFSVIVVVLRSEQGIILGVPWLEWAFAVGMLVLYLGTATVSIAVLTRTQSTLAALTIDADQRHARLRFVHRHDGLTGLLTRQAFDEELEELLAARAPGTEIAVFSIDLDGFKPINDSYSHAAGDAVLVAIAERLRGLAAPRAVVGRLGGDEFALACGDPGLLADPVGFGHRILDAIQAPVDHDGRAMRVGASIGIASSTPALATVSGLCRAADQAMFHCKTSTALRVWRYVPGEVAPRPTLQDRMELSLALAENRIVPHYQPKVRLASRELCGFEALARWQHPTRGLLLPGAFLPQINELGLQGDFLVAIATHVLEDLAELLAEGYDPGQVSINVPEVTLATLTGRAELDRLLDGYPQTLPHLTFEITEDVFITRSGNLIQDSITHFRARGIRISLDDFGTGFASFQHLRELEFDELKIDKSFVAGLGQDTAAEVLIDGFLSIAQGLGVTVVAEGVETEEQRRHLLALGGRIAQGWLFARAEPFGDIRATLRADLALRAPARA